MIFLDLILSAVSPSSNHPISLLVALDDVRFVVKFEIAYFWTSFLHEWNLHVLYVIWYCVPPCTTFVSAFSLDFERWNSFGV